MKFPLPMLLDYVQIDPDALAIGDLLTMAGFELEGIEQVEGDPVLEIKVCSNRGDGLSILGLAREILAKAPGSQPTDLYRRAVARFPREDAIQPSGLVVPISIQTEACSRFAYRGFTNIKNMASPEWIQKRLSQIGQRPISLFVDLTNYVMLEIGQPLHAYDLSKLNGPEIQVRLAHEGEPFRALNGTDHVLKGYHMVIADATHAIGLAGVMGGEDTEVDENTVNVLLEAAHFSNTSVRRTRRELGFNTEASYRFERSVDPQGVVAALNRVADLLGDIGYPAMPGVTDNFAYQSPPAVVPLRLCRAEQLLGMQIPPKDALRYLTDLGFTVLQNEDAWQVTVPSWRTDVHREEDLIEDLGRVHGYEKIPEALPFGATSLGGVAGIYLEEENLIEGALRAGFDEVRSHSLRGDSPLDKAERKVMIRTPGSPDTASVRNSLLPGLAEAARRNGGNGIHLFEVGATFGSGPKPDESMHRQCALYSAGPLWPVDRQAEPEVLANFFSLKGAVNFLAMRAGESVHWQPASHDKRLHPKIQASFSSDHWNGILGRIHPDLAASLGLPLASYLAEWTLGKVAANHLPEFQSLSRNPPIRRDVAFAISRDVPFANVETAIGTALGKNLEKMWLFDVYSGPGIPEGSHSLAIALTLRKPDSNFTDEEANLERAKVVAALEQLGATMR